MMNKKIIIYTGIGLFITAGMAATHVTKEPEWRNLKVIPKNTDEDQMERIMYKFAHDLGVTCSHCHPDTKPGIIPVRVDFATDEKPEKLMARKMMIMTNRINKKYFDFKNDYSFESVKNEIVSCNTCHRGIPKPNKMKLFNN